MAIKFISHFRRGNKSGTGFLAIPKEKSYFLNLGERVLVEIFNKVRFFARIIEYSWKLGVYVPKEIVKKHSLFDKKERVKIKKIKGFYAPIASDGRIYLPYDIVEKESLHQNDIISIKAIESNKVIQKKCAKVYMPIRPKRKTREFICYMDKMLDGRTLLFQIKKLSSVPQNKKINPLLAELLSKTYYAFINKNSAVIFRGNKVPAIINTNLKLSNLAFYLGAYFSDGTKVGNSWAICASTFEQARYYLKMHNLLIKDSKPEFTISYTNIYNLNEDDIKRDLTKIWQREAIVEVEKFRIRKPEGKIFTKWNKYGTLVIREHRQILLDLYNALLKLLVKEILSKKDKKLALDFICGVMEGDGYAPAKKQGHIMIATNKEDVSILKSFLKIIQIKFKMVKAGKNKYGLRIGALEILRNFQELKDKIFVLYPKRRMIFFERLKTVGAVKFLIENHKSTNWVKALLRDNGLCNKNYQLTSKGLKLRNELVTNINKAIA